MGLPENVYYNLVMTNNTTQKKIAQYTDTRSIPIINHCEMYNLVVTKFTIPTSQLPIIQNFPTGASATSQQTGFSVTITNPATAQTSQQFLVYTPIDLIGSKYIYSYNTLVQMVNNAFDLAATAVGLTGATLRPFMVFDSASQLFSIYMPTSYATGSVKVWFNTNLSFLFPSFPYSFYNTVPFSFANTGQYSQIPVANLSNPNQTPITGYNQIIQEFASTISVYTPRSLRFVSGSVPTRLESIPLAGSTVDPSGTNNNSQIILADFDLPLANSIAEIKPFVQYNAIKYRYIDLQTQGSLYQFDLSIFWVDAVGNLYPLYFDPGQSITVKFVFELKSFKS